MSYNVQKKARLKDVKSSVTRLKSITTALEQRVSDIETLSEAILTAMNALIRNITKEE